MPRPTATAAFFTGILSAGCLIVGCTSTVHDRQQSQTVRPDGTAVQQRTQMRETSSGAVVKETETRERKVVEPGPGVTNPDPTQSDPGKQ